MTRNMMSEAHMRAIDRAKELVDEMRQLEADPDKNRNRLEQLTEEWDQLKQSKDYLEGLAKQSS